MTQTLYFHKKTYKEANSVHIIACEKEFKIYHLELKSLGSLKLLHTDEHYIIPYLLTGQLSHKQHTAFGKNINMYRVPDGSEITVHKQKTQVLLIIVKCEYLKDQIQTKQELTGNSSQIFETDVEIGHKLQYILDEIVRNPYPAPIKELVLKTKVHELILEILIQKTTPEANTLRENDANRVQAIKLIIEERYKDNLTIQSLAREVGTNEQYAKKHFKLLYGKTIYQHILECRMIKAKELLIAKEYKIAQVAELSGYKHATHFTSAFKKYYGFKPNVLK